MLKWVHSKLKKNYSIYLSISCSILALIFAWNDLNRLRMLNIIFIFMIILSVMTIIQLRKD